MTSQHIADRAWGYIISNAEGKEILAQNASYDDLLFSVVTLTDALEEVSEAQENIEAIITRWRDGKPTHTPEEATK